MRTSYSYFSVSSVWLFCCWRTTAAQAAISFLASANSVEGKVNSIDDDGDLHVTYTVGSQEYTIERPVPINHFPKIKVGDTIRFCLHPTVRITQASATGRKFMSNSTCAHSSA